MVVAQVNDSELLKGALPFRIVKPRHHFRHIVYFRSDFRGHHVGVVLIGDGGKGVAFLDTGFPKNTLIESVSIDLDTVKRGSQTSEGIRIIVDDNHIVPFCGKQSRQLHPHVPATHHNNVHSSSSLKNFPVQRPKPELVSRKLDPTSGTGLVISVKY